MSENHFVLVIMILYPYTASYQSRRHDGEGSCVEFTGLLVVGCGSILTSRYLNPHCTYDDAGTATWALTRFRFSAGDGSGSQKQRLGQLMGFIARVFDASNGWSSGWVPVDLFFL